MKISRNWLQNFFDSKLPSTAELADAITFHAFEIDGCEQKDGDEVLDIKITPNRGHDAQSHRAIAKEVSTIIKKPIKQENDSMGQGFVERLAAAPRTEVVADTQEETTKRTRKNTNKKQGNKVGPSP